jgi:glycosyltransferase involved in cell wall biosynthesis
MSKSNEIVYINQNAGYLMIDIINAKDNSFKKSIITGKIIPRNNHLGPEVVIHKIITYNRSSNLKRIFTWTWGFLQILFLVKFKFRNAELFIVSNPPFATLLPLFCNNKFSLLIYDIYPDAFVQYGILNKKSKIIRYWESSNKRIYKNAEKIYTLSKGMKSLISNYVNESKIQVVPIWTDNTFLKPIPKLENEFIIQNKLQDKFVVMYSGNLGFSHDVEIIPEIAKIINIPEIEFLIIGDGDKKVLIEQKIKQYNLSNCRLLPWQEPQMLPFSLAAADLSIVTLGKEASLLSVPSKTFNIMSVGTPLLCIASEKSELAYLVKINKVGKIFEANQKNEIKDFIIEMCTNKEFYNIFKNNSLSTSKLFGPDNAFKFNKNKT